MKTIIFLLFIAAFVITAQGQGCSTCGGLKADSANSDAAGPDFQVSMGNMSYGESAGFLTFNGSVPDPILFTPATLQFMSGVLTNVTVITTNLLSVDPIIDTNISDDVTMVTNIFYTTNEDYSGTNIVELLVTNTLWGEDMTSVTNIVATPVTNTVILQVQAPQAVADIPMPPTTNGYIINFYFVSQVTGQAGGLDQFSGQTPFITWVITNSSPPSIDQLQISEYGNVPAYGLMKQWTYTYSTNTGTWTVGDLEGIQKTELTTNLSAGIYQVINSLQYSNAPLASQIINTYETMDWSDWTNVVLVTNAVGAGNDTQLTTYTYWDPSTFNAGSMTLVKTIINPDGSWEYYASYDTNGNPLTVYSSFEDVPLLSYSSGQETVYAYTPSSAGVSSSGDNGTADPNVARRTIQYINGTEISRSYMVFPSTNESLDIQCTVHNPSGGWSDSRNLITTNYFYTSGPNQFLSQYTFLPNGTMTAYYYGTNASYETNITVTGKPDVTGTYVVDGVSNVVVANIYGQSVSSASYDVLSGLTLSQDLYSDFDSYDRPQEVTHLDGTTEYTYYACCGLDYMVDKDGVNTTYLYDSDKRQYGYIKAYSSGTNTLITYENNLDAMGNAIQSFRVGTDGSSVTMSQSGYDSAGELVAQTNALGGVTTYTHANNGSTGASIRSTVDPDGGIITNLYYHQKYFIDILKHPDPFKFPKVGRFIPPHITQRITAQTGIFTIHPSPAEPFEGSSVERFVIANEFRRPLKKMLFRYGVHAASLFPDLDGLTQHIEWMRTDVY